MWRGSWGPRQPIPAPVNGVVAGWVFAAVGVVAIPLLAVVTLQSVLVSDVLGLTEHHEATVVDVDDPDPEDDSPAWAFGVEWEGGAGELSATRDGSNSDLLNDQVWVGDSIPITTLGPHWLGPSIHRPPVSADVGALIMLLVAGWAAWWSLITAWHIVALHRGRARGVPLRGRISRAGATSSRGRSTAITVDLDSGTGRGDGPRRWYGHPTAVKGPLLLGGHVTIWGAGRGWITGRPKGPWVVRPHGFAPRSSVIGWTWKRRGKAGRRDRPARHGTDR